MEHLVGIISEQEKQVGPRTGLKVDAGCKTGDGTLRLGTPPSDVCSFSTIITKQERPFCSPSEGGVSTL